MKEPDKGQWVQVYYNFHRKTLSVQNKKHVIHYADEVLLEDAKFWVSEAGRQRVLAEERKNVHAKIRGHWIDVDTRPDTNWRRVRYNPYVRGCFFYAESEDPIDESDLVYVKGDQIFVSSD